MTRGSYSLLQPLMHVAVHAQVMLPPADMLFIAPIEASIDQARPRLAQEVMRKFREEDVGGRLVYAFTGSSPTAPEVISFLRDALLVPFYEGYGSTEAGMVRARAALVAAATSLLTAFAVAVVFFWVAMFF